MDFRTTILALTLVLFTGLTLCGENLYEGDTSAETQIDTLTRGNYSSGLVPYAWDGKTAFNGKKSIRIDWDRKVRFISTHPSTGNTWFDKEISAANTPDLQMGKTYTFSLYAKASEDDYPVNLQLLPCAGWDFYVPDGTFSKELKLSREWKRYSLTFVPKIKENATVKGYSAVFYFLKSPVGSVWYDAIQIEKGDVPTPYKNPSSMNAGVSLNSPHWSNIYFPIEPVTATVHVDMPPGKAELQCRVADYQDRTVKNFKRTVTGPDEIKIPLNNNRLGWFKVTATLSSDGKTMCSHSANYIRIEKPVNIAPGIKPFAGIINRNGLLDVFDISQKLGVKRTETVANWKCTYMSGVEVSPGKFDWSALEWQLKRGKEFGMRNKVVVNPFTVPDWYFDKDELAAAKTANSVLVLDRTKHKEWRKFIGELTRRYGNLIDEIELGAEDNGQLGHNEYYKTLYPQEVKESWLVGGKPFEDLCAMVKIGAEEIRKTHPNMKIGAMRISRSTDDDNLFFARAMLKIIGKDFNIFPADYYFYPFEFGPLMQQKRGKSDGLFEIYNVTKKAVRELGCDQPVYMSEFGWFIDTRFPDESIYRQEQAETMAKDLVVARAAGFYAFDWFQGFCGISSIGNYCMTMEQNLKIQPIAAAYSAVARVVENVTESKWLIPDRVARIAVMRKIDGKGVAAIWAEKGYRLTLPSEPISASISGPNLSITDFMGNQIQSESNSLNLTQAPIYIWHKDYKELSEALAKANVEMTEFCDIKFRMLTESSGRLQFVNLSKTASLEINAEITVNGKLTNETIDVPKGSDNTCDIQLSGKIVSVKAKINSSKVTIEKAFEVDSLVPIACGTDASSIIASPNSRGDLIPPDPWVPWSGPADLSAKISASWDENNLYVKALVMDDLHFNKFPKDLWNADSFQIAIDPKNNGAFHVPDVCGEKLGPDDLEFCLAQNDDSKNNCVSSHGKSWSPENYTITRAEKEKTTTYTLRLPWKDLGVKPFTGMVFGMSFVIFDDDTGSGQAYYMLVGGGIAGTKNPALYKKFVLKNTCEAMVNMVHPPL